MVEAPRGEESKSIEGVWARIQKAKEIQSVLNGEEGMVEILREEGSVAELCLFPGVTLRGKETDAIIERLARGLGADLTKGKFVSCKRYGLLAHSPKKEVFRYPSSRLENVVMEIELGGTLEWGYHQTRILRIRHLQPKSLLKRVGGRLVRAVQGKKRWIEI